MTNTGIYRDKVGEGGKNILPTLLMQQQLPPRQQDHRCSHCMLLLQHMRPLNFATETISVHFFSFSFSLLNRRKAICSICLLDNLKICHSINTHYIYTKHIILLHHFSSNFFSLILPSIKTPPPHKKTFFPFQFKTTSTQNVYLNVQQIILSSVKLSKLL